VFSAISGQREVTSSSGLLIVAWIALGKATGASIMRILGTLRAFFQHRSNDVNGAATLDRNRIPNFESQRAPIVYTPRGS
jgi:hypothetical protein